MWIWDYDIPQNWAPKTDREWEWFLVRKINYDEFQGLKKNIVKKYFPNIQRFLDPGKRAMLENFFNNNK